MTDIILGKSESELDAIAASEEPMLGLSAADILAALEADFPHPQQVSPEMLRKWLLFLAAQIVVIRKGSL